MRQLNRSIYFSKTDISFQFLLLFVKFWTQINCFKFGRSIKSRLADEFSGHSPGTLCILQMTQFRYWISRNHIKFFIAIQIIMFLTGCIFARLFHWARQIRECYTPSAAFTAIVVNTEGVQKRGLSHSTNR